MKENDNGGGLWLLIMVLSSKVAFVLIALNLLGVTSVSYLIILLLLVPLAVCLVIVALCIVSESW